MPELLALLASVATGVISSLIVTIGIETNRKPSLKILSADPANVPSEPGLHDGVRYVHLKVRNEKLPGWLGWMSRQEATQCWGHVEFLHMDGQNVFGKSMPFRWIRLPKPYQSTVLIHGFPPGRIIDPSRIFTGPMTIPPGGEETLNVAARFVGEDESYGFNNDSFYVLPEGHWGRNPEWKLPQGRYWVRVTVYSSGASATSMFYLSNEGVQEQFRLEPLNAIVKK